MGVSERSAVTRTLAVHVSGGEFAPPGVSLSEDELSDRHKKSRILSC